MERSVKILTASVFFLTIVVVCMVLRTLSSIFIPLVLAFFMTIFFEPLVSKLAEKRIPRMVSVVVIVLILLLLMVLISLFLLGTVTQFTQELPKYQEKIHTFYNQLDQQLLDIMEKVADQVDYDIPEAFSLFSLVKNIQWGDWLSTGLNTVLGHSMGFLSTFVVMVLFLVFMLSEKEPIYNRFHLLMRRNKEKDAADSMENEKDHVKRIVKKISQDTFSYLWLKTLISALTAVVVGFAISLVGMDFVSLWMVITFLFNFIPNIGSIVAVFVIALFGVAQFAPNWGVVFYIFFINGLIQFIIGNWLDPLLQGRRFNLSTVVVFFSLLFWSWLWGIVGMFLAVPLAMMIKIVMSHIPELAFINQMISGDSFESSQTQSAGVIKSFVRKRAAAIAETIKEKIGRKNGK